MALSIAVESRTTKGCPNITILLQILRFENLTHGHSAGINSISNSLLHYSINKVPLRVQLRTVSATVNAQGTLSFEDIE
jgi:hypothetical protein